MFLSETNEESDTSYSMELQFIDHSYMCKNEDIFQKNLLRYTISGRGKQTVESFDSELSLSSLSPGKYKIWVSSSTKDGEYTTPVPIINIVITPPWYKSSWFFSICTLLFILLSIKIALWVFHKKKKEMRDEMGDFVQTVLYNVLGNKEENTKEKDLEEITDASYPQSMEATPLSSADADFIKNWIKLSMRIYQVKTIYQVPDRYHGHEPCIFI